MKKICTIVILIILVALGCQKQQHGKVVAKVGDAELTLEEIKNQLDASLISNKEQLQKYILNWVNEELLYQEALRRGIDRTNQFQSQMNEMKRQLAIQQLIEQQIYLDSVKVNDSTALNYFTQNQAEFFVKDDIIKINSATFATREQAAYFTSQISKGLSWKDAIEKVKSDSALASNLIDMVTEKFFSQKNIYPEEIWKIATALGINEVSFPIKTAKGYSVVQLLARKMKGEKADFEIARDEVVQRIIIENRRKRYTELLNELRNKIKVDILFSQISSSDTSHK
jgi:peptidyl-prolyl cis-trans isomerase C